MSAFDTQTSGIPPRTFSLTPVAAGETKAMTNLVTKVRTVTNDNYVVVFNLFANCVSSERQLDVTKLGINLDELPSGPRKLIQEKIFPKEFMNNYMRFRDRAIAVLERGASVQVAMGYVCSRLEAVAKIADLNAIKADWEEQIKQDSARYDDMCNERITNIALEAYKEGVPANIVNIIVNALRKRQPQWSEFESRMKFDFMPVPVQLELDDNGGVFDPTLFQAQKNGLVAMREGVFGSLVQHIVREANELLKVLEGKKASEGVYAINYRTVARIGSISEKLHGLSFVHRHIAPLAQTIDDALAFMPKEVEKNLPLTAVPFYNLIACLNAMADQHELLQRLRDKQPLVVVKNVPTLTGLNTQEDESTPPALPVQTSSTNVNAQTALPQSQSVAIAAEEDETDASNEVEVAAPVIEQNKFMGLGFMGNSLFE